MCIWFQFGFDISKYSIEFSAHIPSFRFIFKKNFLKGIVYLEAGPFTISVTDNKKVNDWFETRYQLRERGKENEQ